MLKYVTIAARITGNLDAQTAIAQQVFNIFLVLTTIYSKLNPIESDRLNPGKVRPK